MHILFIVPYTPTPIRTRPYNLIRGLAARGHQVTLATLWQDEEERAALGRLEEEGIHILAAHLPRGRALWNCLRALPTRTPLQAVYCWQPALARLLEHATRNTPYDIIHVEHLRGACYGLYLQSPISNLQSPIVWDSVDCISYLFEQAAARSGSFFGRWATRLELGRTRRYEGWLVGQFDRVLVTSEVDKAALEGLARISEAAKQRGGEAAKQRGGEAVKRRSGEAAKQRSSKSAKQRSSKSASSFQLYPIPNTQYPIPNTQYPISVLPNGVALDYFTPSAGPRQPDTLVFTGKMSYHANVTAALYLVEEIMPHVWAQRPRARAWIVGKDPPREVQKLATGEPRITVTGRIPDVRPYLWRAAVAVAPILYGAGIQNKVLEAMACGTPVVATPQAVSALGVVNGEHALVAEDPDAFAAAVLRLLDDAALRQALGQAGRRYVEQHHDWREIVGRLEGTYEEAIVREKS